MKRKLNTRNQAFTLVELLIVIIIIAVLAAIAIPKFSNSSLKSKESALKAELSLLRNAVELFKNDCGAYPAALADLAGNAAPASGFDSAGTSRAIVAADYKGPYVSKISTCPVSTSAFTYTVTSPNVGKVNTPSTVTSSEGTAYNTW
jgi:general secretion pathway protein G